MYMYTFDQAEHSELKDFFFSSRLCIPNKDEPLKISAELPGHVG